MEKKADLLVAEVKVRVGLGVAQQLLTAVLQKDMEAPHKELCVYEKEIVHASVHPLARWCACALAYWVSIYQWQAASVRRTERFLPVEGMRSR